MFKELPILECENDHTKAMTYLLLALTAYRAATQVIYDTNKCDNSLQYLQTNV